MPLASPTVSKVIEPKLFELDAAADKVVLKKVVRPGADAALHLANVHALAGAPMTPPVDAGVSTDAASKP